ncbi:hypothetical protein LCGC14_2813540, partial [marine sediment metagenome]
MKLKDMKNKDLDIRTISYQARKYFLDTKETIQEYFYMCGLRDEALTLSKMEKINHLNNLRWTSFWAGVY